MTLASRVSRVLTVVVVITAVAAPRAHAQIPIISKLFGKKKPPPAAAQAPAATPTSTTQAPPMQGAQPQVAAPQPAQQAPAVQQPAAPVTQPVPQNALSPADKAVLDTTLKHAAAEDGRGNDTTLAGARARLDRWTGISILFPGQQGVTAGLDAAQKNFDRVDSKVTQAGQADQNTQNALNSQVEEAKKALDRGEWRDAQDLLSQVLKKQPGYPAAMALQPRVDRAKKQADLKRLFIIVIAALVVTAAAVVAVGRWGISIRDERRQRRAEFAASRSAMLQIVEGVGRGKHVTIDKDKTVFKIGATAGSSDADRNDLIISDSASLVSRYHCTLVKKDGDYFLVDSSENGTALNGELLGRGDHHRIDDGDEIVLANVSRVKFLHT